jgi:adenine-specific DNA-methyltransferase
MELAEIRTALGRADDLHGLANLAAGMGFEIEQTTLNYLDADASEWIENLKGISTKLVRIGFITDSRERTCGFWMVELKTWGDSNERSRARRRVAKSLVEFAPADDARILIALTCRTTNDIEFVLPKERTDGALGTIRANIDRKKPTNHHLKLIRDLSVAPNMRAVEISRRWHSAFDVEGVTKTFYLQFRNIRDRLMYSLVESNSDHPIIGDEKRKAEVRRYVTRNLGRLLFLWFIQSKRWLNHDSHYLVNLYRIRCLFDGDNFFAGSLHPLFFMGLTLPQEQQIESVRELGDLPYLNGGLFLYTPFEEELYGSDLAHPNIPHFPNELFDPGLESEDGPTVLGLLSSYRFTTQESTPDDLSVDPDPELLGKVFENLNEDDERSSTGTFYTPREIVRFMCREALAAHLRQILGPDLIDHEVDGQATLEWLRQEAIDPRISDRRMSSENRERLHDALDVVTVCDPAVGSGAFMIGMMQEILLLKIGIEQSADVSVDVSGQQVADWKEHIITHCLYGVDLNPEAIEICQLRLWLSLVIEAKHPMPLPNLDFRFVAGDSLIDRLGTIQLAESLPREGFQDGLAFGPLSSLPAIEQKVAQKREEFANLHRADANKDNAAEHAHSVRRDIRELQIEAVRIQLEARSEELTPSLSEALRGMKRVTRMNASNREIASKQKIVDALQGEIELLDRMSKSLDLQFGAKKPLLWPVEFPEVFDNGGFDIVVANPPYIRQENLSDIDQCSYEETFSEIYSGTADILIFFFGRTLQVLKKSGCFAFITSNKFLKAPYGKGLRKILSTQTSINFLIDFGDLPVFDAAAYPSILIGENCPPQMSATIVAADLRDPIRNEIGGSERPMSISSVREELSNIDNYLETFVTKQLDQSSLTEEVWMLSQDGIKLTQTLKQGNDNFASVAGENVFRGLTTGLNEAFVITEEERTQLIRADSRSADLIKPWLKGGDISRWSTASSQMYGIIIQNSSDEDCSTPWKNAVDESEALSIFVREYPSIYEHLRHYEDFPDPNNPNKRKGLRHRADRGRYWWELRSCTYYRSFERQKIVWAKTSKNLAFSWDLSSAYLANTVHFIPGAPLWWLGILNSKVSRFLCATQINLLRGGYIELTPTRLGALVLPSDNTLASEILEPLVKDVIALDDDDEERLQEFESEINKCVANLFGISDADLQIIESWQEN